MKWTAAIALSLISAAGSAQTAPPVRGLKAIAQPNPSLPPAVKQAHPRDTLRGRYRICVVSDGTIGSVTMVTSIQDADQSIIDHIKGTWRYEATQVPVPVCTVQTFVFAPPPPPNGGSGSP